LCSKLVEGTPALNVIAVSIRLAAGKTGYGDHVKGKEFVRIASNSALGGEIHFYVTLVYVL